MPITRKLPLLALVALLGCDSKVKSTVLDDDLQRRFETFQDCFPNLYQRADALLDIAATWKLSNSQAIPDPAGLTFSVNNETGGTVVFVTYAIDGTTIAMTIRFYSPTGAQQDLLTEISGQGTLNQTIRAAADELRDRFGSTDKFMVGDYTISGGGISGADSLSAIIGGSTNQNELEEVRTTLGSSTVNGAIPTTDSATITDAGPPQCIMTFTIPGLLTDETPTQQYPIGTIALTVTGPEDTVGATITFNGSATATVEVDNVPGSFTFNVDTRSLTYVP